MQEANLHRPLRGGRGEGLEYCRRGNIVLKMSAACKTRFPMVKNQNMEQRYDVSIRHRNVYISNIKKQHVFLSPSSWCVVMVILMLVCFPLVWFFPWHWCEYFPLALTQPPTVLPPTAAFLKGKPNHEETGNILYEQVPLSWLPRYISFKNAQQRVKCIFLHQIFRNGFQYWQTSGWDSCVDKGWYLLTRVDMCWQGLIFVDGGWRVCVWN